ncbi:methionyl-tRNA formyltransferase [Corynebacterium falsenii]|uniref:Methionyl-tRNA formyltransferase n=1 Tax=Corynebacterium falsenii TaxID=108486 RepID=A0A418Q847_9CORY|nr:methionyl-tRNA formyltransferase [Corynebacterium falsenii]RIX35680.1 methionyl-tRNA formyltransferase [Corynebacterium falsenii]
MKILFAGTPEPAAVALRHLIADERHEVAAVITQPDARRGRGRTLHPSAVAEVAAEHGIDTYKWPSLKSRTESGDEARAVLRQLADDGVEAVAVVAYGNLIPEDLLNTFRHGWINLHFSVLPRWRGAAPVQAAIAAGDRTTGATTFRIEKGLDTGPMIGTITHEIGLADTADDLLTALTYAGRELLADSLAELADGTATLTPQDDGEATHAAKITSGDAQIDWSLPADQIQRIARAHTPAPGAWSMMAGQRYKIGLMMPLDPDFCLDATTPAPGQVLTEAGKVIVGTGSAPLEIASIQPPGKKMMNAADWARGQQQLLAAEPTFDAKETH